MSNECKRIRCDADDAPGPPSDNGLPMLPYLTDELWALVCVWWPGNYELAWVLPTRLLCSAFAHALKYRVYAHTPYTTTFIQELHLLRTYNQRRRREIGINQYSRSLTMIYCRFFELVPKRKGVEREIDERAYHHGLLDFMKKQGQLMDPEFDGYVARLNNVWARHFTRRCLMRPLEEQLRRIRRGVTAWKDITEA